MHQAASVEEIKEGTAKVMTINNKTIAIFKNNGQFFAITNTCPHAEGPLGEGFLKGDCVVCPWHAFEFNIKNGKCPTNPKLKIETYKTEVKDGKVFVEI